MAKYELSLYDGARKYICISRYTPNKLMHEWKNHNKPMENHLVEDGKEIQVYASDVDYIRIV